MRNIILTSLLLCTVIFTRCTPDMSHIHNEPDVKGTGDTYIRLSTATTRAVAGETLRINSMRVLIFQGDELVFNNLVTNVADTDEDDHWIITSDSQVIRTYSGLSRIYVVLNEEAANTTSVNNPFENAVLTESLLIEFFSDLLSYEPVPVQVDGNTLYELQRVEEGEERAFPMVVFDAVNIPGGHSADDPFPIDLRGVESGSNYGFAMERPMAKITLTRVTNAPMQEGGTDDHLSETALIFVREIGIVNTRREFSWAPRNWAWNDNRSAAIQDDNLPPHTPEYTDDNYYHRNLRLYMSPAEIEAGYFFRNRQQGEDITLTLGGRVTQTARPTDGGRVFWNGQPSHSVRATEAVAFADGLFDPPGGDRDWWDPVRFVRNILGLPASVVADANVVQYLVQNRTEIIESFRVAGVRRSRLIDFKTQQNNAFTAVVGDMLAATPAGQFVPDPWRLEAGVLEGIEVPSIEWELETPLSVYVPERILAASNTPPPKTLHIVAGQVTMEAINSGGFPEPNFGSEDVDLTLSGLHESSSYYAGRTVVFVPAGTPTNQQLATPPGIAAGDGFWVVEAGDVTNPTFENLADIWGFELVRIIDRGTGVSPRFVRGDPNGTGGVLRILSYWTTGAYRWRYLDVTGTMPLSFDDISNETIVDYTETVEFTVPLHNAGFDEGETHFNIYRNRHYQFSLHFTGALNNGSRTTRSADASQEGFMVLRAE